MKSKHILIPVVVAFISLLIVVNQLMWIKNMYGMHRQELVDYANQIGEKAMFMEIGERSEKLGGFSLYSLNLWNPSDTGRYFTKRVRTADSTYFFSIDKHDPHTMDKITQFVIKNSTPVNLHILDSLFRMEMAPRYQIEKSYFDYIDLKSKQLISTNKTDSVARDYLATDTIVLDIDKSIGVVGHIETPNDLILQKMMYQFGLTVVLILCSMAGLGYVSRSFISQWRLEKYRQSSVNAMTHEFKRPISGAVAMVSLIPFYIKKQEWAKVTDYASNILTELNKLTAYTQRIQQISNNEKGNINLTIDRIELKPFFESLQSRYQADAQSEQAVELELMVVSTCTEFKADMLHLSNVMDNLVENAIKYSNSPAQIHIRVDDTLSGLQITVSDKGMGIAAKDLTRIFDKFYRIERKETKNTIGFGLGLTYVKSIVEAHGGTISVQSKLNQGTSFSLVIPT